MLFRRLVVCALLVGVCVGLAVSAVQRFEVMPIIVAAESFESQASPASASPAGQAADSTLHDHDHGSAWAPADGLERTLWTAIANVLTAAGWALILLPLIAWWDRQRGGHKSIWRAGLVWGMTGWFCLFAWPAIGLPPEVPGEAAAALTLRQAWWVLTAVCASAGLALLCLSRHRLRWCGLVLLVLPHLVGAPHLEGTSFPQHGTDVAAQLAVLKARFLWATAMTAGVQWLLTGLVAALLVQRWIRPLLAIQPKVGPIRQPPKQSV